jgi:PAS domain S-box-containing protein
MQSWGAAVVDACNTKQGRSWSSALTREFLADVIDRIAGPVFVKDRASRFVVLNRALCDMAGFPRAEMLGKTDHDFFPKSEADYFRQKDLEVLESGAEVVIEQEPITDASGHKHVLATTKVPLFGRAGDVTHVVGVIHDITRLKAAEEALRVANEQLELRVRERTAALEVAQDELVRKERLAVLGQLAGGLAHQIRNPLGAIANATSILDAALKGISVPHDARRALGVISEETWSANRIITDLLDFARVRPAQPVRADVRELLAQVIAAERIPSAIELRSEAHDLPDVAIDVHQVRDALENLVRNAVEAMPTGGVLTVDARRDGSSVVVRIADTGSGIPDAIRSRLFEPLVTSKPYGMGLGLPTAKALIENQHGALAVVPVARGACFEVRLPIAA